MCWLSNECIWVHTLTPRVAWTFSTCSHVVRVVEAAAIASAPPVCSGAYTPFMCVISLWVCSVGNTFHRMMILVRPLSSHLPVPLTSSFFPVCKNLEIETSLYQSQTSSEVLFWKYTISAVYFSVWYGGGRGCSSTDFFHRHAFHGQHRAESLVLHQPVDVMLGTVVTSWYFKNICYAQQGLLCVPVCHNLDRKGQEAEMATALSLLYVFQHF